MIKKVNITEAASFNSYIQTFCFEKTNIFFGYNGCGKTTFSKIISCLEKRDIIDGLENPIFSIETDNGEFNQNKLQNSLKIKVFNQDYVQKNIRYDSLDGVLVAGEENFEKQKQVEDLRKVIENLRVKLDTKITEKNTFDSIIKESKNKIENLKTDTATQIRQELYTGINYNHFYKDRLEKFKDSQEFENYKDLEINLIQEIQNYNLPNKKIIKIFDKLHNIASDFAPKINIILGSTVLDSIKIPEITSEFESWARDGLELHKNHGNCVFCGSVLTAERKRSLNSHFSDEYKKLLEKINQDINYIQNIKNIKINNDFDWYEDLEEKSSIIIKGLNDEIIDYNNYLSGVIKILEEKKSDIFNTNLEVNYRGFNLDITELNDLVNNHSEKVSNFEAERQNSAHKVITAKILEMKNSSSYKELNESIKTNGESLDLTGKAIQNLSDLINSKKGEIQELEKEIHSLQIGADKFNQYLDELLPKLDLKVETIGNNFVLKRSGFIVKNLSEGERNILSFIYFVLSFSDGNKKSDKLKDNLKDWIVFIDDPMSSLDDSNLHLVSAFIKNHFKHAKQLFVTTHNFAFWRCFRNNSRESGYFHYLRTCLISLTLDLN